MNSHGAARTASGVIQIPFIGHAIAIALMLPPYTSTADSSSHVKIIQQKDLYSTEKVLYKFNLQKNNKL